MTVHVRGMSPTSDLGSRWEALDSEWMALHGFALEVNEQEAAGLLLHVFAARGDNIPTQDLCDALAAAMTAHKDFVGTLGRVTRNGTDIECPTDYTARKLRNRQYDTPDTALISQAKLESFIGFLGACGGMVVLG